MVGVQRHGPADLSQAKSPRTHCTAGCVGPRAGLSGCWEEKISFPPASDVAGRYADYAIPGPLSALDSGVDRYIC